MPDAGDVAPPRCLVISDGRRGIKNQALGLAEACGLLRPLTIQMHEMSPGKAMAAMPPRAQLRLAKFDLPECDMAIGCGRQAIAPLLYLKRSRPDVMTIYVQEPRLDPSAFNLVIAPTHDEVEGVNVETMIGSPNRVTETKIIGETLNFADGLSKLPQPRAAFLIGGSSKSRNLHKDTQDRHLEAAKTLLDSGHSLLVTVSRRTPGFAVLAWKRFASDKDNVWLHDGDGPNPYFAFLGGAELILVTEESTNMLTEACATGKPVFRLPMSGRPGKFQILYDALETRCAVKPYDGQVSGVDYPPLNETARVAQQVWKHFDARLD